jgi:hypothetical protein
MRKIYILSVCLLGFNFCQAQDGASYQDQFSTGNQLLAKQDYLDALNSFQNAYSIDSNACVSYKIGYCIFNLGDNLDEAIKYFEKAVKNVSPQSDLNSNSEKAAPPLAYYYLGILYQKTFHFTEAINAFKAMKPYMAANESQYSADINHLISECSSAKMYVMAPSNAQIIDLGDSINSIYSDYNPLVSQDESSIIFTSRRPMWKDAGSKQAEYDPNIYISYSKGGDSLWSSATLYDKNLNYLTGNTCVSLTFDAQEMILYCSNDKESGLYISRMGDVHWEIPEKLGSDINTTGTQSTACLSPDRNTFYFVSERMGGMGGKDIWRCVKLPNGNWSRALNLGKSINTPYDEETPFMHADGYTFFFSSQGHNSMGGYDIFFSQALDSGKFSEPFNLGYPINTPSDELHFTLNIDGKKGYFNSNRAGTKGKQDIYKVIMPHATERPLTVIRGQVIPQHGEALSDDDDVHILATDSASNQQVGDFKAIKANGRFTIIVPPGRTYTLSYQDNGTEFYNEVIHVPFDAGYKEIHKALTLSPHPLSGSGDAPGKNSK